MIRLRAAALAAALLVLPIAASAQTDQFGLTVTITGTGPFVGTRSDGNVVSNSTVAGVMAAFNGMAPASWVPPAVVPTTMPYAEFWGRLTPAQRKGLWSKMITDTTLADDWWAFQGRVAAAQGVVDPTTPEVVALTAWCVSQGYLNSAQVAALLALP